MRFGMSSEVKQVTEIAAWTGEAGNKAGGDRVAGNHDDRNRARHVLRPCKLGLEGIVSKRKDRATAQDAHRIG
jgi:hypothetical protein